MCTGKQYLHHITGEGQQWWNDNKFDDSGDDGDGKDDDDEDNSVVDFATILRKLVEPAELPDMNFPTLQLILIKPAKIGFLRFGFFQREYCFNQ